MRVSNGRLSAVENLERGQLSHSLRFMADKFGWTVKRVRTFLDRLENDSQTGTQKGIAQNIITICNYELYQSPLAATGTQSTTQTGTQRARKGHKEEQGNKETIDVGPSPVPSGEPEGFSEWYAIFPRKKKRPVAASAYGKLVPAKISHADLLARTAAFASHWQDQSCLRIRRY